MKDDSAPSGLSAALAELEHEKPLEAAPEDVREFASSLSEAHLQCRELGHEWDPWTARWVPGDACYERALRCARCKAERWQTLSSSGAVLTGQYKYPEGYQVHGLGRIVGEGRDALRLESLTRVISRQMKKGA